MIGMISTLVHILHKFFINMHGPVTPRHCYNKHRDDYPLRYWKRIAFTKAVSANLQQYVWFLQGNLAYFTKTIM